MDPATIMAAIQAGTSLYNTFGRNNPARAGGNELGKIQGYGQQAYNPFIQQGQQASQQLSPQYSQMAGNPTDFYNQIMQQYKPSAGFQNQADKLNQLATNKAAAGGYSGTGGDIFEHGEALQGLMGGDMQQFLQNILGIQGAGQAGLQHQGNMGYHAAGSLADYLGTAGGRQANYNAAGKDYSNQSMNNGLSALSGLIGNKQSPGQLYQPLNKLFGGGGSMGSSMGNAGSSFGAGGYNPSWLGR